MTKIVCSATKCLHYKRGGGCKQGTIHVSPGDDKQQEEAFCDNFDLHPRYY